MGSSNLKSLQEEDGVLRVANREPLDANLLEQELHLGDDLGPQCMERMRQFTAHHNWMRYWVHWTASEKTRRELWGR